MLELHNVLKQLLFIRVLRMSTMPLGLDGYSWQPFGPQAFPGYPMSTMHHYPYYPPIGGMPQPPGSQGCVYGPPELHHFGETPRQKGAPGGACGMNHPKCCPVDRVPPQVKNDPGGLFEASFPPDAFSSSWFGAGKDCWMPPLNLGASLHVPDSAHEDFARAPPEGGYPDGASPARGEKRKGELGPPRKKRR